MTAVRWRCSYRILCREMQESARGFSQELSADHPWVSIVETIYLDQLEEMKRQAAAEELA